jgi:hypothetical protein
VADRRFHERSLLAARTFPGHEISGESVDDQRGVAKAGWPISPMCR